MSETRIAAIRQRLTDALEPSYLEVIDESHLHVGHPGAKDGKGHFRVVISSKQFKGLRPIAQHRLVYDAVADLLETDVHALSIEVR
ncbi:MAG: BolA family transcriptional regulator [Bacteroidetes bacterium]|nr:MAG: BolA family transcriptional regulator [Bacteroidota bacterium]